LAKQGEQKLEVNKKMSKMYLFICIHYDNKPWTNTVGPRLKKHDIFKGCYTTQHLRQHTTAHLHLQLRKAKKVCNNKELKISLLFLPRTNLKETKK